MPGKVNFIKRYRVKTKKIFLVVLFCVACIGVHAQQTATEFFVTSPVSVRMPVQGDSINFNGGKFGIAELLKTPVSLDFNQWQYTRMAADTSGYVTVAKAQRDNLFYLFSTNVRAERFMNGTLKVFSSGRFEVYVDGQVKSSNTRAADTISKISPVSVSLRMEPQKDYNIVIKLMSSADDKMDPMLKCVFENGKKNEDIEVFMAPDLKRRFSIFESAFGPKITTLSLSPDGRYLLIGKSESYSVSRSSSNIELKDTRTMETLYNNIPTYAEWMPRTGKLYYTVQGKKTKDLVIFDPQTNERSIIAKDIPDGSFKMSPTEDYLVYNQSDINAKDPGPLRRYLMPDDRVSGSRNRGYVVKYDLATGLTERLTFGSRSVSACDISQDGKKILCVSIKPDITKRPFIKYTVFELDVETHTADTLVKDDPFLKGAIYSPDGSRVLFTGSPEAFGGIGKNCGKHPIANDYDVQAFIYTIASGDVEPITRDFNPSIDKILQWNRTDGNIYFLTVDKDCKNIYRYLAKDKKIEELQLCQDVITSFSLPQDAPAKAAYIGAGTQSAGVAYMYDVKKKVSTLLADPMGEKLSGYELGDVEEWNFTSSDGTLITGLKCLPPNFDPNKKYPLIVYYYGGTTPTTRSMTTPYAPQLFASRDYVVYVIQPSGTIGFGQEFSARHVNAWGDYTANDIIEGTKKFCEAHPFVNSKKIGCLGASYGGFMTQYLQTRTDIFAAAVSHAGISNVTSYWGEGYWGYSYNAIAAAESYPWNNPDLFTKHGSLFNADKINTPLLLLHGSKDTNVPIGESIQLFNALKILGKTVEFIQVDGEDHYIADYKMRSQWHDTIMAWFARWLQDSPQWWNELYKERHW